MGKQHSKTQLSSKKHQQESGLLNAESASPENSKEILWYQKPARGWWPYMVILLVGFGIYSNTFKHEVALDDEMIVVTNRYILKGIAGISEILQTDVFDSYNKANNAEAGLAGGRFRPLSLITFAIEQEFIGTYPDGIAPESAWDTNQNGVGDPSEDLNQDGLFNYRDVEVKGSGLRHMVNVLAYIMSICLLFRVLRRYVFTLWPWLALLFSLLFLVHPLHTEVVANIKSRDEILSLLFLLLALDTGLYGIEAGKRPWVLLSCISYFLALLSKEYGMVFLIILPAALWIWLPSVKLQHQKLWLGGLLIGFLIYYGLRSQVVLGLGGAGASTELLNNPYLLASDAEAWATKIYINLRYFLLMLFPLELNCDYGYQVIAYRQWSDPEVWLSIMLLLLILGLSYWCFRKRHALLVPLLILWLPLFMINNFLFDIGATMGERLVYHSSLGFWLSCTLALQMLLKKLQIPMGWIACLLLPVSIFFAYKTWQRNPAWKNNHSLYKTDIKTHPNSAFLNGNLLAIYAEEAESASEPVRKRQLFDSASFYGNRAIQLHPRYISALLNMAQMKAAMEQPDSMLHFINVYKAINPNAGAVNQVLDIAAAGYYNRGIVYLKENRLPEALIQMNQAHIIKPSDHRPLYFLGVIYARQGQKEKAREALKMGLQFAPNDATLLQELQRLGD